MVVRGSHPYPTETYHRTCRGSSGLGSTPPPGKCPCHTEPAGSGSSHTLGHMRQEEDRRQISLGHLRLLQLLRWPHHSLPPLASTHTVCPDTPMARGSLQATTSSHMALTEPQLGLTALIERAAELRGVPVYRECLSFLTLRHGVWTITTACGERRVTTVI